MQSGTSPLLPLFAALALSACATGQGPERSGPDPEIPSWAGDVGETIEIGPGEVGFVGVGESDRKTVARDAALRDAIGTLSRYVGAKIVARNRLTTRAQYAHSEVADPVETEFGSVVQGSDLAISGAESQYHHEDHGTEGHKVWAKIVLPDGELERMREEFEARHQAQLERERELQAALLAERKGLSEGRQPKLVKVSAEGSVRARNEESYAETERRARAAARHRAQVQLADALHGRTIRSSTYTKRSGEKLEQSFTTAQGHVMSEQIGYWVAWEGDAAIASVTLTGWLPSQEQGEHDD